MGTKGQLGRGLGSDALWGHSCRSPCAWSRRRDEGRGCERGQHSF